MGRPKARLEVSDEQRDRLLAVVRRTTSTQSHVLRARIVLECEKGIDNQDVAKALGTTGQTVGKWRRRFIAEGFEGLFDAPRLGSPRSVSDEIVAATIRKTLDESPKKATHWSTRMMAKERGISPSSVSRIWRAFGLKPHRMDSFSLSGDPFFVEKVRDVVGLYMRPPDNALVLCVDEKSQIQALDRAQPMLPIRPTVNVRQTDRYIRHGTTTLFAALDVATGRVIGKCFRKHRAKEFIAFLTEIDRNVPDHLDLHLILDNYATHKIPDVKRWLLRNPRFQLHFTPTKSSWLNLVESFFSLLSRRKPKRGVHRSTLALEKDIRQFLDVHNDDPVPYQWTKTADQILRSLQRYCDDVAGK
ncbi:MAG: IS630 family transposase [Planctomycetes bacterium]|nr:IS630 family transposase [Planctomycetota bacterium]